MASVAHRRYRAPEEDGAALVEPPLSRADDLIESNRGLNAEAVCPWTEGSLGDATAEARQELLKGARAYTTEYRDFGTGEWLGIDRPFVLAGHQPELFHPGVWFKNFLLSAVAERAGAVPINLIVDSDAVHASGIRVPVLSDGLLRLETLPYDLPGATSAYEERVVIDRALFHSFAMRVSKAVSGVPSQPPEGELLVNRLWRRLEPERNGFLLGRSLAQARHQLEAEYGLKTLEVPLSSVAQTASFRRFSAYLLREAGSLRAAYNAALAEYRQVNRIRSHTHPVPALEEQNGWLEAPFFVWGTDNPRRRALFARRAGSSLQLTDREKISLTLDGSSEKAVDQLDGYEAQGIKLRPRALITTMFARLLLSDVFIHGIGGAKYDELTDSIIRRFFGIVPPAYLTATATFQLPIERPKVLVADVRESAERLRSFVYRPETLLEEPLVTQDAELTAKLEALAAEKRQYLAGHDLRRCKPEVFERLEALNAAMRQLLSPVERELAARHEALVRDLGQAETLGSREFSFVLFNSEILPARLLDLCKVSS